MPAPAATIDVEESRAVKLKACEELRIALEKGTLGEIVAMHETLITNYYADVQQQAGHSRMYFRFRPVRKSIITAGLRRSLPDPAAPAKQP